MFPKSIRPASVGPALLTASCVALTSGLAGCSFDPPRAESSQDPPNASPIAGCSIDCHGDGNSPAPPGSLKGEIDTMLTSVGAHRQHLDPAPTWHKAVECGACHVVPSEVSDPGHMDDADETAEVVFGGLALDNGSTPTWNGATCSGAYCHGSTLAGGGTTDPNWTTVDGSQVTCGSCHGLPPPSPHPNDIELRKLSPHSRSCGSHDLSESWQPHQWHRRRSVRRSRLQRLSMGIPIAPPPPNDLNGNGNTASRGVGAPRAHLVSQPTWYRQIACVSCHTVPLTADDPGHRDGGRAEVRFDGLNPQARYDFEEERCQNLYCHGNGRGSNGEIRWTNQSPTVCGDCHATAQSDGDDDSPRLSGRHDFHLGQSGVNCESCHGGVINASMTIIQPSLHINGAHDVQLSDPEGTWNPANNTCRAKGCHGNNSPHDWFGDGGGGDGD